MVNLSERRRDGEKKEESGVVVVGKALAPQLGSDQAHLVHQKIDQRKLAVLDETVQAALGYFTYRGQKINFWNHVVDWELNSSPSIGGLGRRQLIQMVNAAAGGGRSSLDVAERPNFLARNITERNWKEKAAKQGKAIVE